MLRRCAIGRLPPWYAWDNSADWTLYLQTAQNGAIGYINETLAVYRQHAGGFWTSRSKAEQQLRLVEFYKNAIDCVTAKLRREIGVVFARLCYELGLEQYLASNVVGARRWFSKGLIVEPDFRRVRWTLRSASGSSAKLLLPDDDSQAVSVAVDRIGHGPAYDLQLNQANLRVKNAREYIVRFRAKADRHRTMYVGVAQGHEPWNGLGLYLAIALEPEWRSYETKFTAPSDEDNARIHFDLGESAVGIYIASVSVADAFSGESALLFDVAEAIARDVAAQPLVSVVMPFLNQAGTIRAAIESVMTQTYERWELLLVDDGSTDMSTKIVLEYTRRYPEFMSYLAHDGRETRGTAASRDLGAQKASGQHIVFIEADEVWPDDKLSSLHSLS